MLTSAKNYSKEKTKTDRQDPRTNGKSKALQTKMTQRSIHIHTHKKRKRKYIYISIYILKKGREQPSQ